VLELKEKIAAKTSSMSESFIVKLDKHIDSNFQARLETIVEEKQKCLLEIQHLKSEVNRLAKERNRYREDHVLNKQLKAEIEKNLKEINRINEENKEIKDTNVFLTTQINSLNDRITELDNKENKEDGDAATKACLSNKHQKRLLEYSASPLSDGKHLANLDLNSSPSERQETPKANLNKTNPPETPSSSRRAAQCAQQ
jgi:chromosome segregation ATPase